MPSATPLVPRALRAVRVQLRLDGDLHERPVWAAYAHGYGEFEDLVLDLLTDAGTTHRNCRRCQAVARGGRPAR